MRRTRNATKTDTDEVESKSDVTLQLAGEDGRWRSPSTTQQPEDIVGQILPASLHQYFFFDGERIEQIVRSNQKADIATATKVLLGLKVASRAITHLGTARKTLEKELGAIGNPETQHRLEQKASLEQEIEDITQSQVNIVEKLHNHQQLKQILSTQLRDLAAAKEIQLRRDSLEAQEQATKDELQQSHSRLKEVVSTKGYTVFLRSATAQFRKMVDDLRRRGELPADIKKPFVMDLLTRQRCICGAALHERTPAHHQVHTYLERAGLADVEEAVIRMSAHMETIDQNAVEFWQTVDHQQQSIQDARATLSQIEIALDDIHDQLRNSPSEDIRKLEGRLEAEEASIRSLTLQEGENQQKMADRQAEIEKLMLVLVSKTQWRGEVEEELAPYIGKEYVLVYNSPKPDVQRDEVHLHGEAYPLVKFSSNEFEYTEIIEVTHGA